MIAFIPVLSTPVSSGRVGSFELPAAELAVAVHRGPFGELDRTYGALGTMVAEHAWEWEDPSASTTW